MNAQRQRAFYAAQIEVEEGLNVGDDIEALWADNPLLVEGYCGVCYDEEEFGPWRDAKPLPECCNTCQEVQDAIGHVMVYDHVYHTEQCLWGADFGERMVEGLKSQQHGCLFHGSVTVPKSAGTLQFTPHRNVARIGLKPEDIFEGGLFNMSHYVREFSFGEMASPFLPTANSLGRKFYAQPKDEPSVVFYYYTRAVATLIDMRNNLNSREAYQYSVAILRQNLLEAGVDYPGVTFSYEFSPVRIDYELKDKPISHLLIQVMGATGGIICVAGLVDRFLHASVEQVKSALGKQS